MNKKLPRVKINGETWAYIKPYPLRGIIVAGTQNLEPPPLRLIERRNHE